MKKLLLLPFLLIGSIACQNQFKEDCFLEQKTIPLSSEQITALSYETPKDLTQDQITTAIQLFQEHLPYVEHPNNMVKQEITNIKTSYLNRDGEFSTRMHTTRSSADIDIPIYEVSLQSGSEVGIAIVSNENNIPTILAYIPKLSSEYALERSGANALLKETKMAHLRKIYTAKHLSDSLSQDTKHFLAQQLDINIDEITLDRVRPYISLNQSPTTRNNVITDLPFDEIQAGQYTVMPLIKVNWGEQGAYFSRTMEIMGNMDSNVMQYDLEGPTGPTYAPFPLGSINVAIGQLLTWAKPKSLKVRLYPSDLETTISEQDWADMNSDPNASETSTMVSNLLYYIFSLNKTTPVRNTNGVVVGCNVDDIKLFETMGKWFSFEGSFKNFDAQTIFASLLRGRPTLGFYTDYDAVRHTFIFDGIAFFPKGSITTRSLIENEDAFWHVNFCWNNECTGWYKIESNLSSYFDTTKVDTSSSFIKIIPDIQKK